MHIWTSGTVAIGLLFSSLTRKEWYNRYDQITALTELSYSKLC